MSDRTPQLFEIVECFDGDAYEVEFCNSDGETHVMLTLEQQHTTLDWNPDRNTWILRDPPPASARWSWSN